MAHVHRTEEITIPVPAGDLCGSLSIPPSAVGLVLFAHGSGSGRKSPRNWLVAEALQALGLGTLLFDLLTEREGELDERGAQLRFDIPLLADRLVVATDWALEHRLSRGLPLGCFGASTGAAAALIAAARLPGPVRAVVSRGGRPDLAGDALPAVEAPTLLIVGGNDPEVLKLNRAAMARMRAAVELEIVPGATHLFEEPGALARVAELAALFLRTHLEAKPRSTLSDPSAVEAADVRR